MKNNLLFILFLLIVCSCQSDSEEEQTSRTYIAINMEGRYANELSPEEEELYLEARNRFDNIVKYDNGQYYLTDNNPNHLSISPELYKHFKKMVDNTNSIIKDIDIESGAFIPTNFPSRIKTRSEFEGQTNADGFVSHWYGFEVYLSASSLNKIAAGAGLASVIAGNIPHALAKAISSACGLTAALASVGAAYYPNGVIISFGYALVPGGCVPYNITPQ